ncbi:Uncharacterised protein [Sphingobacterium multivorum]|uniref:Uncharacterized protein n=1 Tax=Sphingobacterium multivorum TaxID=28454 RepID=A0A2X2JF27_SPHMU|nr:Uncharacterised protein [Sphingobacterium multivorum]
MTKNVPKDRLTSLYRLHIYRSVIVGEDAVSFYLQIYID